MRSGPGSDAGVSQDGIGQSGLRIVTYTPFRMLAIYAKSRLEDVPAHILKQLLEAFRDG